MVQTKQQNGLNQPMRLHPLWILFSIGKSIKEVIVPIIFFFVIQVGTDSNVIKYGSIALVAYLVYQFVSTLFTWKNFRYLLTDKHIEVTEGKWRKEKRYVSFDRIQSVQQNTMFFHRLVGLTSLTLPTGASDENASVKLEVISHAQANHIQHHLNLMRSDSPLVEEDVREDTENELESVPSPLRKHYKVTKKELMKAAFTSFHFLTPILVLIPFYFKLEDIFSIDEYAEKAFFSLKSSWILLFMIAIATVILLIASGILITYIRYGNFQISSNTERIFIEKGVFSTTKFSIPKRRVNAIKINRSFLRRWLNIVEVRLVSAGTLGGEELQTDLLFPFISEERLEHLIPAILPEYQMNSKMTKLPSAAMKVNLLRSCLWVIGAAIAIYIWPSYWYIPIALLCLIILSEVITVVLSRYTLNGAFIQLQHGGHLFITKRKKIDELSITESWLQRRYGLATLTVSSRAKPVEVTELSDIPREMAVQYYAWYAAR